MKGKIKPGSCGVLIPGFEARLVDDEGKDVADGEIGTIWIKNDGARLFTGESTKNRRNPSTASGLIPTTSSFVTATGITGSAAVLTICSKREASGFPR